MTCKNRIAHPGRIACLLAATAMLTGCQNQLRAPGAVDDTNIVPGNNGGRTVLSFQNPTQSFDIADNEEKLVAYKLVSSSPATVKLFLDPDLNSDNQNEMDLAPIRQLAGDGTPDEVPLVAGRYPYGTYWVRAVVDDGTTKSSFIAPGSVRIVPSEVNPGEDPGDADLAGLQIIFDAGEPVKVDGSVPFADLWHELDPVDNLSPRVIMPVTISEKVEIHKLRAFTFGRPDMTPRRVEIYKGTNENGAGELIHQIDAVAKSHFAGKWVTVTLDQPVTLEPGEYGFAYHSRYEFTERVAGNAPTGAGYVWLSGFGGDPFRKFGADEIGFEPNFAIRIFGKFTGKGSANRTRVPPVITDNTRLVYRNGAERMTYNPDESLARELNPLHVIWREAVDAETITD